MTVKIFIALSQSGVILPPGYFPATFIYEYSLRQKCSSTDTDFDSHTKSLNAPR